MKTSSLTYKLYCPVDITPLAAKYECIMAAILASMTTRCMSDVSRYSSKLLRLIQVYTRLDARNRLWTRKIDMLLNKRWREQVLRDLGGMRKLKLWDAAWARILSGDSKAVSEPDISEPIWWREPERLAESERLKARVRQCESAAASPHILRDRVKMDFDGLFRLPPLPRKTRPSAIIKIYTQHTISEYDWNSIPFAEQTGFGPAMVWPTEFYAAMVLDGEMDADEVLTYTSVIPHEARSVDDAGPNLIKQHAALGPESNCISQSKIQKVRDDRKKGCGNSREESLPKLPLHLAIPSQTYRALFEDPV